MGASCRCLAAGLLTGYGHLLQHMRKCRRRWRLRLEWVPTLGPARNRVRLRLGSHLPTCQKPFLRKSCMTHGWPARKESSRSGIEDEFAFLEFLPRKIWAFSR